MRTCDADVVLNAIVGAAGLEAPLCGVRVRRRRCAREQGEPGRRRQLVLDARDRSGRALLPVDSEHSAMAQCLEGARRGSVESLVLTASGGPLRGWSAEELEGATREDALDHPDLEMGAKITIDSATLMNKGLELIEAHYLFGDALRPHRGRRASAVDRPRDGAVPRRCAARPCGVARHARADLVGPDPSGAAATRRRSST